MRALSIRQPYAEQILRPPTPPVKTIEYRPRSSHRAVSEVHDSDEDEQPQRCDVDKPDRQREPSLPRW